MLSMGSSTTWCMQLNGDDVGDESVSKHFEDLLESSYKFSTLSKGSCDSIDWGKEGNSGWSSNYNGVAA